MITGILTIFSKDSFALIALLFLCYKVLTTCEECSGEKNKSV